MFDFLMPKLGADMTSGTLVSWHKKPGDSVQRGDIVAEVETDKGVIDVEIFTKGIIEKILAQPGDNVPVGAVLATVKEAEGDAQPVTPAAQPARTTQAAVSSRPMPVPPKPLTETSRLRISPSARALARKLGVDAAAVEGTGQGGAITREDIERTAAVQNPLRRSSDEKEKQLERAARMRQTIAAAMSRSKREIPHYYLSTNIDMHRAMTWLAEENEKRLVTERLLYGVLLLKAVALALREVPELNALWDGGRVVQKEDIHVGAAISLRQGGLIAPALHDTDKQSLSELMNNFRDLVKRARSASLRSSELADPTITVTSLGEQGVESAFGIIYPPQVAIVGFGKIVERPWVVDGQIVPRQVVTATLSADHRVSDGHRGGVFLNVVDRLLQEPDKL